MQHLLKNAIKLVLKKYVNGSDGISADLLNHSDKQQNSPHGNLRNGDCIHMDRKSMLTLFSLLDGINETEIGLKIIKENSLINL